MLSAFPCEMNISFCCSVFCLKYFRSSVTLQQDRNCISTQELNIQRNREEQRGLTTVVNVLCLRNNRAVRCCSLINFAHLGVKFIFHKTSKVYLSTNMYDISVLVFHRNLVLHSPLLQNIARVVGPRKFFKSWKLVQ